MLKAIVAAQILKARLAQLARREDGATFIEYSVLIGLVIVAGVATIMGVGTWADGTWTLLCNTVSNTLVACTP